MYDTGTMCTNVEVGRFVLLQSSLQTTYVEGRPEELVEQNSEPVSRETVSDRRNSSDTFCNVTSLSPQGEEAEGDAGDGAAT